ncbi:hypothetical protein ACQ4PT_048546 [Festuca glaucescens]
MKPATPLPQLPGGVGPCQRRCGGATFPYPFGFSAGCPIPLSCDANTSTPILPHKSGVNSSTWYRVISVNSTISAVMIALPPLCSRSVLDAKSSLSSANYGVSSRTGLFLRGNCSVANASECSVPAALMSSLLRTAQCGENANGTTSVANSTVACVSSALPNTTTADHFLTWDKAEKYQCEDLLTSAVYAETSEGTTSLEFGVAELGWWLNGTCAGGAEGCAANATCTNVTTPSRTPGHRCACVEGMDGDGFSSGDGCYLKSLAKPSSKKKLALIVGGVLAGVAAAGVLTLLCMVRRRRSGGGKCRPGKNRLAAIRLLSEAASSSGVPVYTYNEMARATNSFSHTHRLGTGAYGTVYVGRLPGSSTSPLVAIKRLRCRHDDDDGKAVALLLNEIRLISSLSHPNLVRLLGCCLDRGEHILVYELVPNGTLAQHLHNGGEGGATLPWRARLDVAAGTAAAVAYLHAARPPIFHRDVKSGNILLGADLRPKLADFGLSRGGFGPEDASRSHVSTAPQGTPGYVDPDYHQSFHLSDKSDVYSFGVVLLELITAMRVVDFGRPPSEVNLASLALDRIGKGRVEEIVDPALVGHGEEWVMESVPARQRARIPVPGIRQGRPAVHERGGRGAVPDQGRRPRVRHNGPSRQHG